MPERPLSAEEERAALRAMHAKRRCWYLLDGGASEALHEARCGIFEARKGLAPVLPPGVSHEDYLARRGRCAIVDAVRRIHGRATQLRRKVPHLPYHELLDADEAYAATPPAGDPVARVALERALDEIPLRCVEALLLLMVYGASERAARALGRTESALSQRRAVGRRLLVRQLIRRSRGGVHPLGG